MGEWAYKAKGPRGKIQEGVLSAADKKSAQKQLRELKLRVVSLKPYKETFLSRLIVKDKDGNMVLQLGSGLPGLRELAIFTKQFALMIERGVPLIQALGILADQQKQIRFSEILIKIRNMVENGATLSTAMATFPKVFNDLYVAMIRSGEVSGSLDKVLLEMVKFLEKSAKLRKQIKSASMYPAMIAGVATAITYGIMVFLVPVFAEQYAGLNKELPAMTQVVVNISDFLTEYIMHVVIGAISAFFGVSWYRKTPTGKVAFDNLLLKLPLTGDVMLKVSIGRFTSTMSTMMAAGVSILDALQICAESSGNKVIEDFVKNISNKISQGSTFADPLGEGNLFPPMVVSMVAVGEQTGALDETLIKVSEIYEEEVDEAVKNMTDMFQPILIVGIGSILGFVIIALYLPIFDQASLVGG